MEKNKTIKLIILLAAIFLPVFAFAAVTLENNYPTLPEGSSVGGTGSSFLIYIFTLLVYAGGGVAILAIIYQGITILISAGNMAKVSEAKDRIKAALFGLVILLGSYLILVAINPDLTKINLANVIKNGINWSGPAEQNKAGISYQEIPLGSIIESVLIPDSTSEGQRYNYSQLINKTEEQCFIYDSAGNTIDRNGDNVIDNKDTVEGLDMSICMDNLLTALEIKIKAFNGNKYICTDEEGQIGPIDKMKNDIVTGCTSDRCAAWPSVTAPSISDPANGCVSPECRAWLGKVDQSVFPAYPSDPDGYLNGCKTKEITCTDSDGNEQKDTDCDMKCQACGGPRSNDEGCQNIPRIPPFYTQNPFNQNDPVFTYVSCQTEESKCEEKELYYEKYNKDKVEMEKNLPDELKNLSDCKYDSNADKYIYGKVLCDAKQALFKSRNYSKDDLVNFSNNRPVGLEDDYADGHGCAYDIWGEKFVWTPKADSNCPAATPTATITTAFNYDPCSTRKDMDCQRKEMFYRINGHKLDKMPAELVDLTGCQYEWDVGSFIGSDGVLDPKFLTFMEGQERFLSFKKYFDNRIEDLNKARDVLNNDKTKNILSLSEFQTLQDKSTDSIATDQFYTKTSNTFDSVAYRSFNCTVYNGGNSNNLCVKGELLKLKETGYAFLPGEKYNNLNTLGEGEAILANTAADDSYINDSKAVGGINSGGWPFAQKRIWNNRLAADDEKGNAKDNNLYNSGDPATLYVLSNPGTTDPTKYPEAARAGIIDNSPTNNACTLTKGDKQTKEKDQINKETLISRIPIGELADGLSNYVTQLDGIIDETNKYIQYTIDAADALANKLPENCKCPVTTDVNQFGKTIEQGTEWTGTKDDCEKTGGPCKGTICPLTQPACGQPTAKAQAFCAADVCNCPTCTTKTTYNSNCSKNINNMYSYDFGAFGPDANHPCNEYSGFVNIYEDPKDPTKVTGRVKTIIKGPGYDASACLQLKDRCTMQQDIDLTYGANNRNDYAARNSISGCSGMVLFTEDFVLNGPNAKWPLDYWHLGSYLTCDQIKKSAKDCTFNGLALHEYVGCTSGSFTRQTLNSGYVTFPSLLTYKPKGVAVPADGGVVKTKTCTSVPTQADNEKTPPPTFQVCPYNEIVKQQCHIYKKVDGAVLSDIEGVSPDQPCKAKVPGYLQSIELWQKRLWDFQYYIDPLPTDENRFTLLDTLNVSRSRFNQCIQGFGQPYKEAATSTYLFTCEEGISAQKLGSLLILPEFPAHNSLLDTNLTNPDETWNCYPFNSSKLTDQEKTDCFYNKDKGSKCQTYIKNYTNDFYCCQGRP